MSVATAIRQRALRGSTDYTAERREDALDYLAGRTGTYHFRARRYAHVCAQLERMGLADGDLIIDVGAGMCELGKYLYGSGWWGRYLPVDAAIDGADVDRWTPALPGTFVVALELIEHLEDPARFLAVVEQSCERGAVLTTPNGAQVDVLALDVTHRHALRREDFEGLPGWTVESAPLFGREHDTLVAVFDPELRLAIKTGGLHPAAQARCAR